MVVDSPKKKTGKRKNRVDSDEVKEVEMVEGKSSRKRTDWEQEERIWRKQVENDLTDFKGMVRFSMKVNMETSRQVQRMVEKLLVDDDADDDDGSGVEEPVPAQGTEDVEMEVIVGAEEKVDSEKEVEEIAEFFFFFRKLLII